MNYVGTHSDDTLILMGINKPTFLFYENIFKTNTNLIMRFLLKI